MNNNEGAIGVINNQEIVRFVIQTASIYLATFLLFFASKILYRSSINENVEDFKSWLKEIIKLQQLSAEDLLLGTHLIVTSCILVIRHWHIASSSAIHPALILALLLFGLLGLCLFIHFNAWEVDNTNKRWKKICGIPKMRLKIINGIFVSNMLGMFYLMTTSIYIEILILNSNS